MSSSWAASADDRSHAARVKLPDRHAHGQEDVRLSGSSAAVPEMGHDRLADIIGQRQLIEAMGFAVDRDLPGAPIEIVQS